MSLGFENFLKGMAGGYANYWATNNATKNLQSIANDSIDAYTNIANNVNNGTTFTPSTITPGPSVGGPAGGNMLLPDFGMPDTPTAPNIGNNAYYTAGGPAPDVFNSGPVGPDGLPTGPNQMPFTAEQVQAGLLGGVNGEQIKALLGGGTGRTEAELYGLMEGIQQPGRDQQRSELEQRLAAQGRLGVSTAMYGGTPEQLAMEKAIAQQKSQNAMNAFQLTGEEQARMAGQTLQAYGLGESSAARQNQNWLASWGLTNDAYNTGVNAQLGYGKLGLDAYLGKEGLGLEGAKLGLMADQNAMQNYMNQANFYTNMGGLYNDAYKNSFLGDQLAFNYAQLEQESALGKQANSLTAKQIASNAEMNAANLKAQSAYQAAMIEAQQQQNLINLALGTINAQGGTDGGLLNQVFGLLGGTP